jgi:hypothetical protein
MEEMGLEPATKNILLIVIAPNEAGKGFKGRGLFQGIVRTD